MIVLDVKQGSLKWTQARLGIPTASQASRIVTPTGRLSKSRDGYLAQLLAEWALGENVNDFAGTEWMERGKVLEPEARRYYAFHADAEPATVGLVYRDETRMASCSPDGLVGDDGLLELKCPSAPKHVLWLAQGGCPREHWPQVQMQLWCCQRQWCDFFSYFPGLPPFIVRVEPDPDYQGALDAALPFFISQILAGRKRLEELGVIPSEFSSEPQVKETVYPF